MKLLLLSSLATLATAHFTIDFPEWRGSSFANGTSQWIYPCANVSQETANRTLWPLEGGAVGLDLHHPWTYYAINLGVGNTVGSFNVTLTTDLQRAEGTGHLCLPKVAIPSGLVSEGTNATLQFVTFGASGSALYNCADITFSASAVAPSDGQCKTSNVTVATMAIAGSTASTASGTASAASASKTSGAEALGARGYAVSGAFAVVAAVGVSALL